MAARGTRPASSHEGQISQLRDQLQGLVSEHVAPALANAADAVADPVQKLLSYATLAAEVLPQLRQLLRRRPDAPPPLRSRAGLLRRHPVITSTIAFGLALGAGLVAYKLIGSRRPRRRGAAGDRSEPKLP